MVSPVADEFMIFILRAKFGVLGQLVDDLTELAKVFVLLFYPFVILFELIRVKDVQESSSLNN